ncbi:MAG: carboxylating nicotinate-nucleotide diphosphorylase [Peptoniphilus sp.]|nr:carboxylating nicotinate-nucleotide diphosphorylase [Peptoniphilus sp.]MDD7362645.1 carboxylating nicotinate-nucleotide diphosphorylase [Bacillota bacterium]MDY6044956.1 carboxylating nicotinate-nucleotide diphosphorylase [Peptoniphilus sp.]
MVAQLHDFLIDRYLLEALREDVNEEDVSTNAVIGDERGHVFLIAKEEGVIAGLGVFERVFTLLDESIAVDLLKKDGDHVSTGDTVATIRGPIKVLLTGERVALNFLQRMSGIATYTEKIARALEGTKTDIVDTRKTTPNFRIFEKYAVRVGGGKNHRYNLTDGVMLKDNHIAAAGSVEKAVALAREYAPFVRKIEVEVETIDMVEEAVAAKADIIMLDNMSPEEIKEAVRIIDGRALIELSGNIDEANIDAYKDLGADVISSGALTHSAPVLDLSMKGLVADDAD